MITTYSVIIQNKKTAEAFSKYQPLFTEALNNNRIGVCKWVESGTTLETAVPELAELTNDKQDWRAIVVMTEDELAMKNFERDERNPFDFKVNSEMDETVRESEIPLIRLTHMLGGVPAPELKFVSEKIIEEHKAPRVVYRPVVDKEQEEAHKQLSKKYKFDGNLPSSIILITIRTDYEQKDVIDHVWTSHRESNASEFWKRNHYPANCRFLVYDFVKKGPVQRSADEFGFWMSVLLLATNVTDSGTLQAYRLYKLNTKINKDLMRKNFLDMAVRLKSARHIIEKEIKKDIAGQVTYEEVLPEYRMEIPVNITTPKMEDCGVKTGGFKLLSKGPRTDLGMWNNRQRAAEEALETSVRKADRTLDQTADKMRELCVFTEEEVSALSKYQREDMTRETGDIYNKIVTEQGDLPTVKITSNKQMKAAAEAVKETLKGRVAEKPAYSVLGIALALILLFQLPSMFVGKTSFMSVLVSAAVMFLIVLFAVFINLSWQKAKLDTLMNRYNTLVKAAFARLIASASDYSTYLSDIASHSRGHSYLDLSGRKKHKMDNKHAVKYKHIKAINILLAKLRTWANAYHLRADLDNVDIDENVQVDISVPPAKSGMYTFETGNSYQISVNNSGVKIYSPFEFVEKLEIIREELYDDGNN
ncbi:MAG: hypothetical protein IJN37_00435 [Clostridia bacterium]|nr:hypothetical protein [Clostridia bacterium]